MASFEWQGTTLFFRERGKGSPMVILPGNTASSVAHQGEMAYFEDRYRTLSLDFLGTGQSDRVSDWSIDYWDQGALQVKALLDHLGLETCIAVGTSGGGAVALLLAIKYPGSVRAVIADSCIEKFDTGIAKSHIVEDRSHMTEDHVRFWKLCHGDDWEQVVDADTKMIERFAHEKGDWFSGKLKDIRCPVLLTASRQDEVLPDIARQIVSMAGQIPDCYVYLHPEGLHPLMWSHPDDFRCMANCFLAKAERSP